MAYFDPCMPNRHVLRGSIFHVTCRHVWGGDSHRVLNLSTSEDTFRQVILTEKTELDTFEGVILTKIEWDTFRGVILTLDEMAYFAYFSAVDGILDCIFGIFGPYRMLKDTFSGGVLGLVWGWF